jgi:hypothetical protein
MLPWPLSLPPAGKMMGKWWLKSWLTERFRGDLSNLYSATSKNIYFRGAEYSFLGGCWIVVPI